jgi:hypothetical protein
MRLGKAENIPCDCRVLAGLPQGFGGSTGVLPADSSGPTA